MSVMWMPGMSEGKRRANGRRGGNAQKARLKRRGASRALIISLPGLQEDLAYRLPNCNGIAKILIFGSNKVPKGSNSLVLLNTK